MSMIDVSQAERRIADRVDPGIANQIAVSDQAGGVAFRDAGEMMEFAKLMAVANSGVRKHLRGNVGACLAILTQALEWGMSPFAVANKSYFVNDQIAFESQLVQAVILKRAPIRGRIKYEFSGEGETRVCRAWAQLREDDEEVDYTSPPIGKIPVKNSPLWKGDPDQQLAYYSGRALCRRHFPDVLLGTLDRDEVEERPAIGPDRARDITPPRGMQAKLDALAAKPEPEREAASTDIDHDPETGEIAEQTSTSSREEGDAEDGVDHDEPTPHDLVLDKLRRAAMDSLGKLKRVLGGLSAEEQKLVTPEDRAALERTASRQTEGAVA